MRNGELKGWVEREDGEETIELMARAMNLLSVGIGGTNNPHIQEAFFLLGKVTSRVSELELESERMKSCQAN